MTNLITVKFGTKYGPEFVNKIYNDIKDEKFKKLDSFGKEPEYEKIIHKYIKNNKSKNELKDVLKDKGASDA